MGMGGVPDGIRARLEAGTASEPAVLCSGVSGARLFARDGVREESVSLADIGSFGAGWLPLERAGRERWRPTGGRESEVLVQLDAPLALAVAVTARPPAVADASGSSWSLHVNGKALETYPLGAGEATYSWVAPAELWRTGTNRLTLVRSEAPAAPPTDGGARPSLRVIAIRLRPVPSAP
jgi:hypothetical protein